MRPMLLILSLLALAPATDAQVLGLNPKLVGSRLGGPGDHGLGLENVVMKSNGEVFVISAAPSANGAAGAGVGRVKIWRTDPNGAMGEIVWEREGRVSHAGFGFSMAVVGDQNVDGIPDFVVASPGDNRLDCYSGDASRGFPWMYSVISTAPSGNIFGGKVFAAGDVDGDGVEDVGVAEIAPLGSGRYGKVEIHHGGFPVLLRTYTSQTTDDLFGGDVTKIGDVDSDGTPDVIISAPGTNFGAGAVHCYSGATGALLWSFNGNASEEFGTSLLATTDPNNNQPIVVAGGPSQYFRQRGAVRAIDGKTGQQLGSTIQGNVAALFGRSLTEADATGDGVKDLIVGAAGEDTLYVYRAPSYSLWGVIQGFAGQAHGTDLATIDGTGGRPDTLVVGAPGAMHPTLGQQTGRVDLRTFEPWWFQAQYHQIPSTTGGSVPFDAGFPPQNAGDVYVTLVTLSGTSPGIQLAPGVHLQLNPDGLTIGALTNPGLLLTNEIGTLQPGGLPQGTIRFNVPPLPGLTLQFHHAIVLLDATTGAVKLATDPVPIRMES